MNNKLIIIGFGGHGRVCREIAIMNGYQDVFFLDDDTSNNKLIIGNTKDIQKYIAGYDFFVAIGNNATRKKCFEEIENLNGNIISLIHPNSIISPSAKIGKGVFIMAGVIVNAQAKIGNGVILNTSCSIEHDCKVGDFSHVSVGSHLAGGAVVGKNVHLACGVNIATGVSICDNAVLNAGYVATKNIEKADTYSLNLK